MVFSEHFKSEKAAKEPLRTKKLEAKLRLADHLHRISSIKKSGFTKRHRVCVRERVDLLKDRRGAKLFWPPLNQYLLGK